MTKHFLLPDCEKCDLTSSDPVCAEDDHVYHNECCAECHGTKAKGEGPCDLSSSFIPLDDDTLRLDIQSFRGSDQFKIRNGGQSKHCHNSGIQKQGGSRSSVLHSQKDEEHVQCGSFPFLFLIQYAEKPTDLQHPSRS